ncbi:MAG: SusC/RagA family TonB-linked outer membrane protein, partial [Marinilabiliaceae bacterium]|nr:SusC/RagA family TonB-linked outer membrane protein [Marinilabiliaceae bacterium]
MKKTKKLIKETWFLEMKKLIRIMKLTCFLLIFSMTCILANNNYSQTKLLNVKMEEQTLKEILSEIENQSEFYFMYSSKLIDVNRKVTVNFENQKIDQVLNSLFAGTDINYVIKDRIIVLASSVLTDDEIPVIMQQQSVSDKVTDSDEKPAVMQQQSLSVSGNVIDVDGEPIPGVSIIIKGTAKGTITDTYGNYSLSDISEKAILVFSFVGMLTQEIVVGNQTIINATMEQDIVGLEEVVVIGYGTAKKSDLTGAVVRADLTTMENSPNVNIIQSIKGVVPGLNIGVATTAGEDPTIQIRGQKSITSTAGAVGPLIVLDGIIYRGRLTDINPNDIGSIDVLKDASSAAIYGSQSANGVILITTKTATKLSKPIIEYSTQFATQRLISNKMQRLDDEGFVQQMKDVFIGESRMGDDLLQENPDFDVTTKFKDIVVTEGYYAGTNTDWYSLLSNPHPYIQNHNISVRGNNELANYFMSFGYTDQKNIVKNDNYKRYSFRINLDTKVTDWLKLGTQTYYNISDYSGTNTTFGALCQIPAQITPYNADGSLVERTYLGGLNPLLSIDNPNVDVRNVLSGTFYSEISIPWIKGLSYRVNYSRYAENYKNYTFDPYFENNQGSGSKKISNTLSSTFDNIVTYKREFDKHSVNMTLVYGVEKREYETTTATARNFTNMTLIYNKLDVGQADLQKALSGAWKESSLYSMARMVYSFNDRYMFTGTFRRDGFSGFTEKNKFGIFPSLGLGWRLSEEDFFKNSLSFVDNFKLRISYGQGGNRTAERYSSLASISTYEDAASTIVGGYLYGDGATGQLSQAIATMANSSLKWETTTSTNFGVDFSVLKGRVYGNYEFYTSKTKDLLYDVSTPQINGTYNTNVATNIGQLQNTG